MDESTKRQIEQSRPTGETPGGDLPERGITTGQSGGRRPASAEDLARGFSEVDSGSDVLDSPFPDLYTERPKKSGFLRRNDYYDNER